MNWFCLNSSQWLIYQHWTLYTNFSAKLLCLLILVWVFLTLIPGHRVQESKIFCANYVTRFSIDLNKIWFVIETCWPDGPHTLFYSIYSEERKPCLTDVRGEGGGIFYEDLLAFGHLLSNFFKDSYDDKLYSTPHFVTSLNDLHSKVTVLWKINICCTCYFA